MEYANFFVRREQRPYTPLNACYKNSSNAAWELECGNFTPLVYF